MEGEKTMSTSSAALQVRFREPKAECVRVPARQRVLWRVFRTHAAKLDKEKTERYVTLCRIHGLAGLRYGG